MVVPSFHGNCVAFSLSFHLETKGRLRKRVVLVNVPSFRFSFRGNIRQNHPFGKPPFCQSPIFLMIVLMGSEGKAKTRMNAALCYTAAWICSVTPYEVMDRQKTTAATTTSTLTMVTTTTSTMTTTTTTTHENNHDNDNDK